MNHLIFTAVLTAYLGIGGYQQGPEFFGPSPDGLGHDPHYNPVYTFMYYILTYFAGSFGRYNVHAKVFCWLMTMYPIVTALTGFQFTNLLPYIVQVVPIVTGYYIMELTQELYQHMSGSTHTDNMMYANIQ
ncbi:hypothetical protein DSO57_1000022 [Entomophthora muscae]|uniref:Uncharacterized protein n=1 Tax=Entomophthora muscae TaxID=34485 RepID=A0ACC2SLZ5_9FUNG|nr:hypothetical protein DSO57_1000022 [Entomophthora muscae]